MTVLVDPKKSAGADDGLGEHARVARAVEFQKSNGRTKTCRRCRAMYSAAADKCPLCLKRG